MISTTLRSFLASTRCRFRARSANLFYALGVRYYDRKQYRAALKLWTVAGRQSHPSAAFRTGVIYQRGEGVIPSIGEARTWYERAARLGHVEAELHLGRMLIDGVAPHPYPGTPQAWRQAVLAKSRPTTTSELVFPHGLEVKADPEAAFFWISKAAGDQCAGAHALLGNLYHNGRGCERDLGAALRHYSIAADKGLADAQFALGDMYFKGEGTTTNYGEAAHWFEKAAQDIPRAKSALAYLLAKGIGVSPDIPRAVNLYVEAAAQDDAMALYHIGIRRLCGDGLPKEVTNAETMLRKSAKQNYLPAIQRLAELYAHGLDGEPDFREAAVWYQKAAALGDHYSKFFMGQLCATGKGVAPNLRAAARWFSQAAEGGHALAAYNLALCYLNGSGVTRDMERAVRWLNVAGSAGVVSAQIHLGHLYWFGNGVSRSVSDARFWFQKASDSGDPEAITAHIIFRLKTAPEPETFANAKAELTRLAEEDYAPACLQLGNLLAGNFGGSADAREAERWYARAAEKGILEAQFILGVRYLNPRGIRNTKAAALWLEKAARLGYPPAQFQLGLMLRIGSAVHTDQRQALLLYNSAAHIDRQVAQRSSEELLVKGKCSAAEAEQAFEWIAKAAAQGMPEAQIAAGDALRFGVGTIKNEASARHWYRLAAKQGYHLGGSRMQGMDDSAI